MPLIRVGTVLSTFGVKGFLKCAYTTDNPQLLPERQSYLLSDPVSNECRMLDIAELKLRQRDFLVRFEGFASPERARVLRGWDLCCWVQVGELPREVDEVYYFELVGLEVRRPDGTVIGRVGDIVETAAHVLLQLAEPAQRLLPFTRQYVPEIDLAEGYLVSSYPLEVREDDR